MNRRNPALRQAPDYRAESESLAALYGTGDATDDREAGRQQSARARRLEALIATAHRRELGESERDELSRLVSGRTDIEEPK